MLAVFPVPEIAVTSPETLTESFTSTVAPVADIPAMLFSLSMQQVLLLVLNFFVLSQTLLLFLQKHFVSSYGIEARRALKEAQGSPGSDSSSLASTECP